MGNTKIYFDPANNEIHLKDTPESGNNHLIWSEFDVPVSPTPTPSITVSPTPTPTPTPSAAASFDDWFLPSQDELNAIYTNAYEYGVDTFWSSSDYSAVASFAYLQDFSTGNQTFGLKSGNEAVIAARTFTDSPGAYNLGDTGPAGGFIFYISGSTSYYESSPTAIATTVPWANVTTPVSTGTAIGTGQANTTAIIALPGSTGTAAWGCDNYST